MCVTPTSNLSTIDFRIFCKKIRGTYKFFQICSFIFHIFFFVRMTLNSAEHRGWAEQIL